MIKTNKLALLVINLDLSLLDLFQLNSN